MGEFKSYDSQATLEIHNARLTKDADVKDGDRGKMVSITFVITSRNERDSELWVEAQVNDFQAELAAHLQKGDVLGVSGLPVLQRYGDDNEKFAFKIRRAQIMPSVDLFVALKERGFEPGGGGEKKSAGKSSGKPASKGAAKPAGKKMPSTAKRKVVDLDEDGDE